VHVHTLHSCCVPCPCSRYQVGGRQSQHSVHHISDDSNWRREEDEERRGKVRELRLVRAWELRDARYAVAAEIIQGCAECGVSTFEWTVSVSCVCRGTDHWLCFLSVSDFRSQFIILCLRSMLDVGSNRTLNAPKHPYPSKSLLNWQYKTQKMALIHFCLNIVLHRHTGKVSAAHACVTRAIICNLLKRSWTVIIGIGMFRHITFFNNIY
jgi:hypothetical protein